MTINNNTSQRETMMQLATKYSDLLVYLDENNVNQDTILPIIKHAIKIGVISEDAIKRLNKGTGTKRGVNQLRFDDVKKTLFVYNTTCQQDMRLFLSQTLFQSIIGGNVQTIVSEYKKYQHEINNHNFNNGFSKNDNYANTKIAAYIKRAGYGSIREYLSSLGFSFIK